MEYISNLPISKRGDERTLTWPARDPSTGKSLILDLDNTLIYTFLHIAEVVEEKDPRKYSLTKKQSLLYTNRPYLDEFLEKLHPYFEIILYSAGEADYVEDMVNSNPILAQKVDHILCRNNCFIRNYRFKMKHLDIITNRQKSNLIIIDDKISVWLEDLDNLIPINSYKGDEKDDFLLKLINVLTILGQTKDVREDLLIQYFKLNEKYINLKKSWENIQQRLKCP